MKKKKLVVETFSEENLYIIKAKQFCLGGVLGGASNGAALSSLLEETLRSEEKILLSFEGVRNYCGKFIITCFSPLIDKYGENLFETVIILKPDNPQTTSYDLASEFLSVIKKSK